jgi:hypothetical protein
MDFSFNEQDLIVLEGFVGNNEQWALLKKFMDFEVQKFWSALRSTDISDEKRVAANHKLAVGVETFRNELIRDIEMLYESRTTLKAKGAQPDVTAELLGGN